MPKTLNDIGLNNKAPDHAQNGNRGLLAAGIFAFAALLATGFFMTLSQGNIMFLKILIARIPGCGGLF